MGAYGSPACPIFAFLGEPFVALLIATVAAMLILGLGHGYNTGELEKVMTKSRIQDNQHKGDKDYAYNCPEAWQLGFIEISLVGNMPGRWELLAW